MKRSTVRDGAENAVRATTLRADPVEREIRLGGVYSRVVVDHTSAGLSFYLELKAMR